MSNSITSPFPIFTDVDGNPLESGYIYIGEPNQNPETTPITVYWDSLMTTPVAQPIRTIGGYPSNSGTPGVLYAQGDFSITVRNKNGTFIYSASKESDVLTTLTSLSSMDSLIGYTTALNNQSVNVSGYYTENDGGGGLFNWDSTADKSTANAGTIIDPSVSLANQGSGVGNGCWIRQYNGNVNVKWFGAKGDGITDDSTAIQAAMDCVGSLIYGGTVFIPNGVFLITSQGSIDTRNYGLLHESNVTLLGENTRLSILKSDTNQNIDVITTPRLTAVDNISIFKLTIDGNSPNQTDGGFSLWYRNATNIKIDMVTSKDSGSWGFRIQECSDVFMGEIETDHIEESNADGVHFIDTHDVVIDKVRIYTAGDDGFIIQGEGGDSYNYSIGEIIVSAPAAIAPARGVTFFSDVNVTSVERKVYNISIANIISYGCAGPAFNILGCTAYNIDVTISDIGSNNACALIAGTALAKGDITNSSFNIVSLDAVEQAMYSTIVDGVIESNSIDMLITNPGDNLVGAALRGDKWLGNISIDYDPSSTKISPASALDMYATNSSLGLNIDGGTYNLFLNAGADGNVFTSAILNNSITSSIRNVSGATGNTINSGSTDTLPSGIDGLVLGKVNGLYSEGKTTLTTDATGVILIPHGMLGTPQIALANILTTSPYIITVQALDATNINVIVRDYAGAGIATTSVTIMWQASYS